MPSQDPEGLLPYSRTIGEIFLRDENRKINNLANNQACLSVFGFLHTIDPNIVGFEVVIVNDQTEEWEVKTLYGNGTEGRLYGKGIKVHSIVDGGHFDLEPFDQFMERMAANEEFCDTRLEPREEPEDRI